MADNNDDVPVLYAKGTPPERIRGEQALRSRVAARRQEAAGKDDQED